MSEDERNGTVVRMKQAVQDRAKSVSGWAGEQARAVDRTIHERPVAVASISAGTAFAVGLLLGLLLPRPQISRPDLSRVTDGLMHLRDEGAASIHSLRRRFG